MKASRATITALSALATSTHCFVRAFSIKKAASNRAISAIISRKTSLLTTDHTSRASTALPMIFDKLFSSLGGGGGFAAKIDYSAIPYPVPELAAAALDGEVPKEMEKNGKTYQLATFAGGYFWGLELAFQRVTGVEYTGVGYTQGRESEPNYDAVCAGATGHTEAVLVLYDPNECTYESLLDTFFSRVDPLTVNGQGSDRGKQYRTGVYYHSKEQEEIAKGRFEMEQQKYPKRKIATEFLQALPFWPAEKYHQQYLEKGGRIGSSQSAEKGCTDTIRCYG